jgi:hypothetical protein
MVESSARWRAQQAFQSVNALILAETSSGLWPIQSVIAMPHNEPAEHNTRGCAGTAAGCGAHRPPWMADDAAVSINVGKAQKCDCLVSHRAHCTRNALWFFWEVQAFRIPLEFSS